MLTAWLRLKSPPAIVTLVMIAPLAGYSALLSYEGFDYTPGSVIFGQTGGFGFSNAWQTNSSAGVATNMPGSLDYQDTFGNRLQTVGGKLFIQGNLATNGATQPNRTLSYFRGTNATGLDGVTTWVSFLAVRQGPTTNSTTVPNNPYPRSANVSLYNSSPSNTEKLAMGNSADIPANNVAIIPTGNATNTKPSQVSYSRTNLIVVRVDHLVGANDNAYLFVNPTLGIEPNLSAADTNSLGSWDFSFNRVRPFAGGNNPSLQQPYAELVLDEIRIGETYADVTPFIPALRLTRNGSTATLNWTGVFTLQSATNVLGPFSNVSGATNGQVVSLTGPAQFFRLAQ